MPAPRGRARRWGGHSGRRRRSRPAAGARPHCPVAGSGSAQTASSKSRASSPSMVTSGMARRSSRLPSVTGRALSASASASGGKVSGRPRATAVISVSAAGSSGRPTRSLTTARASPRRRSGLIEATTRSPGSAPARSRRATTNSARALRSAERMRSPSRARLDDAGHLARLPRQHPDRPGLVAALAGRLQARQDPVADGRRGAVQVLDRQDDPQLAAARDRPGAGRRRRRCR